jgi:sulfhydrogenase subunit beta (sulfur reductase)
MIKNDTILEKLVNQWLTDYFIFAPQKTVDGLRITEVKDFSEIDWSGKMPDDPWKRLFLPAREKLFDINKKTGELKEIVGQQPKVMCLGMNVLDLKALMLFDLVFANDVYYQNRRENTIVVGYSADWPAEYKKLKVFSYNFEEDVLEHLHFDIFIAGIKGKRIIFYSGSSIGRKLLEEAGIKEFKNIKFAGAIAEEGPDQRMIQIKEKFERSADHSLWDQLDKICIACGKCSIACPTCFCFDLEDKMNPENSRRDRVWGNCFYNDFSLVAGGHKELDSVKSKIYFWYLHKFLRIPEEYKVPGCVSCGRCTKVCPVGIDIAKNIAQLMKIRKK